MGPRGGGARCDNHGCPAEEENVEPEKGICCIHEDSLRSMGSNGVGLNVSGRVHVKLEFRVRHVRELAYARVLEPLAIVVSSLARDVVVIAQCPRNGATLPALPIVGLIFRGRPEEGP